MILLQKNNLFLRKYKASVLIFSSCLLISILYLLQVILKQQTQQLKPLATPFPVTYADIPLLTDTYMPHISAQGAFVMDDTSRVVLYAKNENIRLSPASTTKIMTTLVALDTYKPNDLLTVKRTGIEPVVVGFPLGAKVTFHDALYGLLLPSGNDVAYMLADNYPGGFSAFIAAMNAKAKMLHLDNTHYADPAGLVDDEDYTTPKDLAMLASYAIKHPVLAQVVDTKEKIIHDSFGNTYDVKNLNELLGKYGVNGIKTGYTGEAGEVLVTSSVMQGHTIIIVVMKSDDRFADTEKLLQLVQKNLTYLSVHP